jgi:hypothetical protein
METLEQGAERSPVRPRLRLAVISLLAASIALAGAGWLIDARWQDTATADLTLAFDETLTSIEIAERRVQSVTEYARPARDRVDVDPSVRESLDELVRDAAADSAADIATQRDRIDAVRLLPWHTDLQTARDQAGAWLDLRASGIVSLADTGRATYPPRDQLDAARSELRDAWATIQRSAQARP